MSSLFNNRNFSADKPMKKLTTNITYLPFGPKRLYLSSIMDLHNGEIIAYTISSKQDTKFVLDILNQIDLPKDVLLHSYIVIKAAFILLLNTTIYVIQIVENYIKYYNEKRIQQKLDYLFPVFNRRQVVLGCFY